MTIRRPGLALCITFCVAIVLNVWGLRDGALLLFSLLAGIFIYKILASY